MKTSSILCLFIMISSWSFSQDSNQNIMKCVPPVDKKDQGYCDSVFLGLREATYTELSEIVGFTSGIVFKMQNFTSKGTINSSFEEFYYSLNNKDKSSFKNKWLKLNDNYVNYFNLPKEDREKIIKVIDKKRLNLKERKELKNNIPKQERKGILNEIREINLPSDKNEKILDELRKSDS